MTTTGIDWIKPGAEVVIYRTNGINPGALAKKTIAKVATKSFTVEGVAERFQMDTCKTKASGGGSWSSWRWHALQPDCDLAKELIAKERKRELMSSARVAVEQWQQDRPQENRLAAISALQNVED